MESQDILDKEIDSWKGFEYALREENRTLFNKMLSNKEGYADCMSARGENFSTEVLFVILIYEQQKMINELITRLVEEKTRLTPSRMLEFHGRLREWLSETNGHNS